MFECQADVTVQALQAVQALCNISLCGLKRERMRKMTFHIPVLSIEQNHQKQNTVHFLLSSPQPSSLPLENITSLSSQKQILHHAGDQLAGPLIVLTLGTVISLDYLK